MLKEYTLIAHHGGEYNAQTVGKEYVVNMMNNRRTLHKNISLMRDVSLMSRLQLRAICLMLRVPAFWTSSLAAW